MEYSPIHLNVVSLTMSQVAVAQSPFAVIPVLPEPWPEVVDSYLTETHLRGGSVRTPTEYARILARFFAAFPNPGEVQPIGVHSFAYGRSPGSGLPAAATICVRLAAIAGLYDFARRIGAISRNPAADIRRPRPTAALPRGLAADDLRRLLAAVPSSRAGRRDRAIILLILLTGLRRSEVFSLRVGDIDFETGDYAVRVKGGRERRRQIPPPALAAIVDALLAEARAPGIEPEAPLFTISGAGFYASLRRYAAIVDLEAVSPHVLRHSAAQLRRGAGASIEDVSALLGHASIATTARYLRRLEPERDDGWSAAAAALGIGETARPMRPSRRSTRSRGSPKRKRPDRCVNTRPVRAIGGQDAPYQGQTLRASDSRRKRDHGGTAVAR